SGIRLPAGTPRRKPGAVGGHTNIAPRYPAPGQGRPPNADKQWSCPGREGRQTGRRGMAFTTRAPPLDSLVDCPPPVSHRTPASVAACGSILFRADSGQDERRVVPHFWVVVTQELDQDGHGSRVVPGRTDVGPWKEAPGPRPHDLDRTRRGRGRGRRRRAPN